MLTPFHEIVTPQKPTFVLTASHFKHERLLTDITRSKDLPIELLQTSLKGTYFAKFTSRIAAQDIRMVLPSAIMPCLNGGP